METCCNPQWENLHDTYNFGELDVNGCEGDGKSRGDVAYDDFIQEDDSKGKGYDKGMGES